MRRPIALPERLDEMPLYRAQAEASRFALGNKERRLQQQGQFTEARMTSNLILNVLSTIVSILKAKDHFPPSNFGDQN